MKVKKQIIKNGQVSFKIVEVPDGIAEQQLSLPNEKRHSHWRNVERLEETAVAAKVVLPTKAPVLPKADLGSIEPVKERRKPGPKPKIEENDDNV
jgi:hypothetical protein